MKHCILLSPFSGRLTEEEKAELRRTVIQNYRRISGHDDPSETVFKYAISRAELVKANNFADYRDDCLRELLRKGYAPFAPHAIYPQVLDDSIPEDRTLGLEAGYAVYSALMPCPVFVGDDHGISTGMSEEITWFQEIELDALAAHLFRNGEGASLGTEIFFRSKGEWPA